MALLSNPAGQLAAGRLVVGIGSWVAPKLVSRALAVDPDANPNSPYIMRLFGVRDVILGVGVLTTSGAERKRWLQAGLVCDLVDAAAAGVSAKEGSLGSTTAVMGAAAALGAVVLGALALHGDS